MVRSTRLSEVLRGMVRPMRPLSMRKIREVLRLRHECHGHADGDRGNVGALAERLEVDRAWP
mgnify:CR=1 FL=1